MKFLAFIVGSCGIILAGYAVYHVWILAHTFIEIIGAIFITGLWLTLPIGLYAILTD